MKNVLLLSCSTGEGHNSAAHAIETVLLRRGIDCEVVDPISFRSERMQHAVSSLYNNLIKKRPKAFGAVYKLGDIYCTAELPSPVYWANSRYADALQAYILDQHFDAVICTHLYGMEAMTAIRKDPDFHVPCYGVLTDYVCIPFLDETRLDGYFVPNKQTREHLLGKGLNPDTVWITGIPVNGSFASHPDRQTARKALGIDPDRKLYLLMTGGVGCENMLGMCRSLVAGLRADGLVYVLTGKNDRFRQKLEEEYGDNPQIRAVPFTREVPTYMAAANVMISKPGGLSSTEAAVANVPLVLVHGIPGCETYNARFFQDHGMAFSAETEADAALFAHILAYNRESAENMQSLQRRYVNPRAAEDIVQRVMDA